MANIVGSAPFSFFFLFFFRCFIFKPTGPSTLILHGTEPGPEVIKLFSCSTQLSMKLFLLKNIEMPTAVGISTFMSRKNSILGLSEPEND